MRPVHLTEALARRPIAWLVMSPLEWHGEAVAFGADPLVGRTITELAWEQTGGVLLPPLCIGVETEYKVWEQNGQTTYWGLEVDAREHLPGSVYVRPVTFELVLRDYLSALRREGFRLVVVVTGHGGCEHMQVMEEIRDRGWGPMQVVVWNGADAAHDLPAHLSIHTANDTGHADATEASLVGGIDPSLVDRTAFGGSERDRKTGLLPENAAAIDFEKGRAIIVHNAAQLAAKVSEVLEAMTP